MNIKKISIIVLFSLLIIQFVASANLLITSNPVIDTIINDNNEPAIFDVTIKNNGASADFEIYTFEKFRIEPSEFYLSNGDTKTLRFAFYPIDSMRSNDGYVKFPVLIKEKSGRNPQSFELDVKLINFENAFDIKGSDINIDSKTIDIYVYNMEDVSYENIAVVFSSEFFGEIKRIFSLKPYEVQIVNVGVDKSKLEKLVYGTYPINSYVTIDGRTEEIIGEVKIIEKSEIITNEDKSGIFIRKILIEKVNQGNVPIVSGISVRKNIISRLFSTFSLEPNKVERGGFFVDYYWQKELAPSEKLSVQVTTNLFFPLILIFGISLIVYLFNLYFSTHVIIKKRVSFVKTKTDDFALKVTLNVRARRFAERVKIYDKIPSMAKLYESYHTGSSKVDKERGIIKWDVERFPAGSERVFSYVIYSKMKIIGKFEMPLAHATYDVLGKNYRAVSNKTFFINETNNNSER